MKKIIYISIFFPILLFASIENRLLNDINSTYSNDFYKTVFKDANILRLGSPTRENALLKIKEDFEKILPEYLACETLFSTKEFKSIDKRKHAFVKFIKASLVYIDYLEHEKRATEAKAVMRKNLISAHALMTSTNEIFDYIIALNLYMTIDSHYDRPSKDMISLFNKYPMPDKSIYFQKLKSEQIRALNVVSQISTTAYFKGISLNNNLKESIISDIRSSATSYIDLYYSKMVQAIKSESKAEIVDFRQYIQQEEPWYKVNLTSYSKLLKVKSLFFENLDYSYGANNIGQRIALAAVPNPKLDSLYFKHIQTAKNFNILIQNASL